jgi:cytidylate kinase
MRSSQSLSDKHRLIIAIDGPAASGKSTLGRLLARALNLLYIDTGSMYRAVALAVIQGRLDPSETKAIETLAENVDVDLAGAADHLRVLLNGNDVTEAIRTDEVTEMSSIVSTIGGVRRAMVARQREMGRRGAVLNGRDIGTVVFPNANVKFFLTAGADERARRRFREEQPQNAAVSLSETYTEIVERDRRDSTRTDSPLKIAEDAVVIDSSGLSIEQVLQKMLEVVAARSHHEASGETN